MFRRMRCVHFGNYVTHLHQERLCVYSHNPQSVVHPQQHRLYAEELWWLAAPWFLLCMPSLRETLRRSSTRASITLCYLACSTSTTVSHSACANFNLIALIYRSRRAAGGRDRSAPVGVECSQFDARALCARVVGVGCVSRAGRSQPIFIEIVRIGSNTRGPPSRACVWILHRIIWVMTVA